MYLLALRGQNNRFLGEFPINEARFTLGRLINPDNRDEDATRFLALFGDDALLVSAAKDLTLTLTNLHADYPTVEILTDGELAHDPEIDVDELVLFVKKVSALNLDTMPDKQFTVTVYQKQQAVVKR